MEDRKVLISVSGDDSDAMAIETAVEIAQPFGGIVRGLYAIEPESREVRRLRTHLLDCCFWRSKEGLKLRIFLALKSNEPRRREVRL